MNSLRRASERSLGGKGSFARRDVLIGGSVLPERISIRNGHGLKEQATYQDSGSRIVAGAVQGAVGTGANHAPLEIRGPPRTPPARTPCRAASPRICCPSEPRSTLTVT